MDTINIYIVRSSSPLIFGSNSEIDRLRSSPPPQCNIFIIIISIYLYC